ncbi:MAG: hypothetical protein JO190_05975 [Candidatus Eremiobacteraeota bacterium]|nr:hypothetical protein [Candidatus Eremiobacteraeota bacterium]MBV8499588.1 hypothetical protein [Candidatus Eremiobacteraeota bacterium]
MRNSLLRAAAALFVTAAFVACRGIGAYNPSAPAGPAQAPSANETGAVKIPACTAKKLEPGTYLLYNATGKVKGTTFKAFTGKSATSSWFLFKYIKAKPTPTPSPSPSPSASPTPKPYSLYFYYGTFAMKNKQTGCAFLEATENHKNFRGTDFNALTSGFPNMEPGHYNVKLIERGLISALSISKLSPKGGYGSATLVTTREKPYTSGSITLKGRVLIKIPNEAQRLLQALSDGEY